ncbi:MAG: magnesium transporter [Ruminococcaceae bacterium]|nr:magnesium transporter [Oscillospiraceae bacterium]MBQ6874304.1 magnesium transporter [Clostridia bacterium]
MEFDENLFWELFELLRDNKLKELKEELVEINYADIAEFIMLIEDEKAAVKVFRIMPKNISAEVFAYLDSDWQQVIIQSISDKEIAGLMDELFLDDAVDFLEEVPANVVRRVLANTDKETRDTINRFLEYPDNCAGSVMTVEMVELHDRLNVKEAIAHIRATGVDKETIYTCYCIDDSRHLVGTLPLRRLLLSNEDMKIKDIMLDDEMVVSVQALDDQEEVAALAKKYDLLSVPVVDKENRLVGIITIDDIVDIIEEEATEDFEKMASLTPSDDEYLKTGVLSLAKNRIPWLIVLLVTSTFTGYIIDGFENKLAVVAGLTACIPMLMGTGGNSGSQVSTLIIRGLALGEIRTRDYLKVLWKEIRVSLIVGVVLALVNALRMILLRGTFLGSDATNNVVLVVSLAILCVVVVAKVMGCTLPIVAKLLKLDPAMMTGPMISTVVDAVSLLIYFSLANAIIDFGV